MVPPPLMQLSVINTSIEHFKYLYCEVIHDHSFHRYLDLLDLVENVDYYDFISGDFGTSNLVDFWGELYENNNFDYEDFTIETGFRLNESLIQCRWKGFSCSAQNFTKVIRFYHLLFDTKEKLLKSDAVQKIELPV